MMFPHKLFSATLLSAAVLVTAAFASPVPAVRFGFYGLHGGTFDAIKPFGGPLAIELVYFSDADLHRPDCDFTKYDVVFLQHLRSEDKEHFERLLRQARAKNPRFVALSCSNLPAMLLGSLAQEGLLKDDKTVWKYCSNSVDHENLKNMLAYVAVTYAGRPGKAPPPQEAAIPLIAHPDAPAGTVWTNMNDFLAWTAKARPDIGKKGRVLVTAHVMHLVFQQAAVVPALVKAFEKRGYLAVAITDMTPGYDERETAFRPNLVVHTCHGNETPGEREKLDVPHICSLYTKRSSLTDYLVTPGIGLQAGELQHQVTSQELKGTIDPLFVACSPVGGGSDAVEPVPERVEHLVDRAEALIRLRTRPNAEKKIAIVYYDRSMGKSELMRGTATGMFMNAPRSLLRVLNRLEKEGYSLSNVPTSEDDLLERMKDHGRQMGNWLPETLKSLAESGKAVLVPVETYVRWFNERVPEPMRAALIHQWGPPPGRFMVYEKDGRQFLVIPRLDLGNVILLPQPLRGEAHSVADANALVHDKLTPPTHQYLATYFWLQETFRADAMVHFGTHGSEFLLPGKPEGLVRSDWCDRILGAMPNFSIWIINNVGESTPVKRRAYATIIDHLTPPLVTADLSDELKNLQGDIQKWETVGEGALQTRFAESILSQVRKQHLDRDLKLAEPLTTNMIPMVDRYLEQIANESTPISLHVLGQVPPEKLLLPFIVRCAGKPFLKELGAVAHTNEAASRVLAARALTELIARTNAAPAEVLAGLGLRDLPKPLPKELAEGFAFMAKLHADYQHTDNEINNLIRGLGGHFIPAGPANSPDRNPGSVPTGRNMFLVNPEEIPTPQSWELGQKLLDEMLRIHASQHGGAYPEKVAFSLNSFSSYRDYGIIESQIFALIGVKPIWDRRRQVEDVEIIPRQKLGRPRIDVFLATRSYYRDQLPTRMKLIDEAIRRVIALDEPDNRVRQHTLKVEAELVARGVAPARATTLAKARMFGYPPGQMGSGWYYYLAEKTGEWKDRADLMKTYLEQCQYAYTEGAWGEEAKEAYERTIQGTELVIRSWSDSVASPLSNKYMWWVDGSLSQAVKFLTGKEPAYYFADVRDTQNARMVSSSDALNEDFHVRLFNRKWIEGMKKEGYAGADQVAVHVANMIGWEAVREDSISADQWQEVVNIYLRDSKGMHLREWFEKSNPHALQNVEQTLLEVIRKGYWRPPEAVVREIAEAYDQSVARHGGSGGIRGGGNRPFQEFLTKTLGRAPAPSERPVAPQAPKAAVKPSAPPAHPAAAQAPAPVRVTGRRLAAVPKHSPLVPLAAALIALGFFVYGFFSRKGSL